MRRGRGGIIVAGESETFEMRRRLLSHTASTICVVRFEAKSDGACRGKFLQAYRI